MLLLKLVAFYFALVSMPEIRSCAYEPSDSCRCAATTQGLPDDYRAHVWACKPYIACLVYVMLK